MSKPTFTEVANGFTFDLSEIQKNEIYGEVAEAYQRGWNEGYDSGHKDGKEVGFNEAFDECEEPEINEEHLGVKYTVEAFDTVTTFEEFQTKYLELVRLNLSYTPPLGLHKFGGQQLFKNR